MTTDTDTESPQQLEALIAETDAEQDYPDGTIAVPLAGTTIHILPPDEWTSSAQQDLAAGRFNDWAQDCLAGDDYDTVWIELNDGRGPKIGEITAMFTEWAKLTGQQTGKSRELQRSLRSMRRR